MKKTNGGRADGSKSANGQGQHRKNAKKALAIIPRDPTINPEDFIGILSPCEDDIETAREKAWGRKL